MKYLKRSFAALTAAVVCLMGTPVLPELTSTVTAAASEEKLTYGDLIYEVDQDETIAIVGCDKSATKAEIPEQIDGMPVQSIATHAFTDCKSLTSVTIPESVSHIGTAFYRCTSLTDILVDSRNERYVSADGVLFDKKWNELICYPAGKEGVYFIPDGTEEIAMGAFFSCAGLTGVVIPDSVTSIYTQAFSHCTSLTNVIIPDGVKGIYNYTFAGCTNLTEVRIPETVTMIGWGAFSDCTSLISIAIPASVTGIDTKAFNGTGLTSVTLPESVTGMGDLVFAQCHDLTSITIPKGLTKIGAYAFFGSSNLSDVYYTGTEEQWNAVEIGQGNDELARVTMHYQAVSDVPLGDVSGEGLVNASDAALVLIAAAQIGAGDDPNLAEVQRKAADVNKDEKINASDAAIILMYAAAVGAGDKDVKIEDFVMG